MKPKRWLSRLNRVQNALAFKVIASILVVAMCVGFVGWRAVAAADARITPLTAPEAPTGDNGKPDAEAQKQYAEYQMLLRGENALLGRSGDFTGQAVGAAIAGGLSLCVIWLGLGITSLAMLGVLGAVVAPLWLIGASMPATVGVGRFLRAAAAFIAALGVLTMAFVVLMQLLKIALDAPLRPLAIARNVVNEAVRLKVSLVFIVLLIFALAALPGLLNDTTPLRYRVQSFLQYGSGGMFWIIAVLVLFLSVGTVAFEQRDRVIWQTITKPVAPWEYLLGKWLGVVGVAAVLLAVSSSGVFLFTEYLRMQPAVGEYEAFQPASGGPGLTEDRLVLENEVLAARRRVEPAPPELNDKALQERVDARVKKAMQSDPTFQDTAAARRQLEDDIIKEHVADARSVEPGRESDQFRFEGLGAVRRSGKPITFQYKIDVGANDPRTVYRLAFSFGDFKPLVVDVPAGQMMSEQLQAAAVDPDGTLRLRVMNFGDTANQQQSETISFPPDGLRVYFAAGSYRMNYLRVMGVLWLKLAFLAMVGVTAATFLSFSVASLVAFGVFLMAESSGFLIHSLKYYNASDNHGHVYIYKILIRAIALPVSWTFQFYSNIKPTENLVDGRLLPWTTVILATLLFGVLSLILYGAGVAIFRRRQLAMYSGH